MSFAASTASVVFLGTAGMMGVASPYTLTPDSQAKHHS